MRARADPLFSGLSYLRDGNPEDCCARQELNLRPAGSKSPTEPPETQEDRINTDKSQGS